MNWKQIAKKYPKAIEKFGEWYCCTNDSMWISYDKSQAVFCKIGHESEVNDRDLYEFFDENGITIIIDLFSQDRPALSPASVFGWKLFGIAFIPNSNAYKTRLEAETKAFEKAFEILNKKLNP